MRHYSVCKLFQVNNPQISDLHFYFTRLSVHQTFTAPVTRSLIKCKVMGPTYHLNIWLHKNSILWQQPMILSIYLTPNTIQNLPSCTVACEICHNVDHNCRGTSSWIKDLLRIAYWPTKYKWDLFKPMSTGDMFLE